MVEYKVKGASNPSSTFSAARHVAEAMKQTALAASNGESEPVAGLKQLRTLHLAFDELLFQLTEILDE